MIAQNLTIEESAVRKLLGTANPDAALLYIFVHGGNSPAQAEESLRMTSSRLSCATAVLRQLGLWPEECRSTIAPGEQPSYTEQDVLNASTSSAFQGLSQEVSRILGRNLSTEDLKILLGFTNYLGLPTEVIIVLIHFCKEREFQRGKTRRVSLFTIQKEAYRWAENGIDTMEEASAYIQNQNLRQTRLQRLLPILQIRGRSLTKAEEKYAQSWLDAGFEESVIAMAYERTCLNTGGLNWAYMNKILQRWAGQGLMTAEAIQRGDRKDTVPKGASGEFGQAELEAIQRVLREG